MAASRIDDRQISRVFVYGTLRRDAPAVPGWKRILHQLRRGSQWIGRGRATGQLYDLGLYPGMIDAPDREERRTSVNSIAAGDPRWVIGDMYQLIEPGRDDLLATLDEYEDCRPGDAEGSLYRRETRTITLDTGDTCMAWLYLFNRPLPTNAVHIPNGDYLGRPQFRPPN